MIERIEWEDVSRAVNRIGNSWASSSVRAVYGVPRGGLAPALLVAERLGVKVVETDQLGKVPRGMLLVVDDLVDSGGTLSQYLGGPTDALFRKPHAPSHLAPGAESRDGWLEFPWERDQRETPAEDAVRRVLQAIGENPEREGLLETPKRVVKSWRELFGGYAIDPVSVLKEFEQQYNEIVLMKNIELYSTCEHHMLPFIGRAHVAYIPKEGKVVGASKLARLVEVFARRLQIQERICDQVTEILMIHLEAQGAACIIEAKHLCICARGVGKQNSEMVTSSVQGVFRDNPMARAELMGLIRG